MCGHLSHQHDPGATDFQKVHAVPDVVLLEPLLQVQLCGPAGDLSRSDLKRLDYLNLVSPELWKLFPLICVGDLR